MILRGIVRSYDYRARSGNVEISEVSIVNATNYIYPSDIPSEDLVNGLLSPFDKNTVLPAHDFYSGSVVAVYKDVFDNYFILGNILNEPMVVTTTTVAPENLYKLGKFIINKTSQVDENGNIIITPFANRAIVRKIKITKLDGGPFTVKVFDSNNEIQASWGDGEIILEDELIDDAGFFFESENFSARINLLPVSLYKIYVVGERLA